MSRVIYIGSAPDIDPSETDTRSENASALVGYTYSESNGMRIVDMTPNEGPSPNNPHITGDNDNNGTNDGGDTVTYDLGSGPVTEKLDSTIWVTVNAKLGDDTPATLYLALIQTKTGQMFLVEDYNYPGQADNQNIQDIRITAIRQANTTGWVFENLKGTGEQYSIEDARIVCFASGTLIETDQGLAAIEHLSAGDLVLTRDSGLQPIRWIGSKKLSTAELRTTSKLCPIRIRAGALGKGSPTRDLMVSRQHRVLVRSKIAQRMFGAEEILVAAKNLLEIDGIEIAKDIREVEYFHILFDQHEVIFSNGAETESLHTGPQVLRSLDTAARDEIFAIFPELRDQDWADIRCAVRLFVDGYKAKRLAHRHRKNNLSLFAQAKFEGQPGCFHF